MRTAQPYILCVVAAVAMRRSKAGGATGHTLAVVAVGVLAAGADRHVLVVHPVAAARAAVLAGVVVGAGVVLATQLAARACARTKIMSS